MLKKTVLSALLLGAAVFAVHRRRRPQAGWRHPGFHPHARFVFRHDFRHFSPIEHNRWVGGGWHHMRWHGRFGWWWGVGGAFYWYPAPVYPYPAEVSSTYYDDDGDDNGGGYDNNAGPGRPGRQLMARGTTAPSPRVTTPISRTAKADGNPCRRSPTTCRAGRKVDPDRRAARITARRRATSTTTAINRRRLRRTKAS